jgi:hypothetical protein
MNESTIKSINNEDKSQYLKCLANTSYYIGDDKLSEIELKIITVKPISDEKVKNNYNIEDKKLCNIYANTLTCLDCIYNYTISEDKNTVCLISSIPLNNVYRELWRESLDKVCCNAPDNWDIIVLSYHTNKNIQLLNIYEPYSEEYDPKVYIIRSESAKLLMNTLYIPGFNNDRKKFNISKLNISNFNIDNILFENLKTYIYKYPFFQCLELNIKQKQDDLMYDRYSNIYKSAEIVVSRYNESLEWLKIYPFNKLPVVVYNKGSNDNYYKSPNIIRTINLPNLGKCDHTYIYHIIENYDKLKDVTIFLSGSLDLLPHKMRNSRMIIESLEHNLCSTMVVHYISNVRRSIYNFTLLEYNSSDSRNKTDNIKLHPAEIRPYGKWFDNKFGDLIINAITYFGTFSVSSNHIKNRCVEFYNELLRELSVSNNPEVGHYIERSWLAIFYPMEGCCLIPTPN